jgi:hypothetical protein
MRTFQRWVGDEHPYQYDENWRNLLWAGPLAAAIGTGMYLGNKKKTDVPVPPQAQVQHVQQAHGGPPDEKKIVSKKVTAPDAGDFVSPTEPQKVSGRQTPDVGPGKSTRGLRSEKPVIKDTEEQPEEKQVQVVHDKEPPTPEEIRISQGHPSVKAVRGEGAPVVYRSIGSAVVNNRDLNSAIKLARAVAVNNLRQQIQNKGVLRFKQGADKDVKIYTKSSRNGGVVCVFVVRDFNPEGISITPERDDEGLPRESTSHRSFQSYATYRRRNRM